MPRGSNLLRLGDFNQAVVLDVVRRSTGISRAELGRRSGLSPQTVSNIARRLLDEELIREGEPSEATKGRPSIPLTVEGGGAFAVGVLIDPTRLSIVLVDLAGEIRGETRVPTPPASRPREVVNLIAEVVLQLVRDSGVAHDRVLGIGIAAPGPIDVEAGIVVDPPQLPNWRDVELRSELHAATGLPVLLDKDVTAAATAELRAQAETVDSFLFLYLGSGVGAGIALGSNVLRGVSNNIGEIGDMLVDDEAEDLGWPGVRGGLAAACVPEALVLQAQQAYILPTVPLLDYAVIDSALTDLCELAASGHEGARSLLARAARRVAVGLGTIVNLLDLDTVILGGPVWPRLAPFFLEPLPALIAETLVATRRSVRVMGSAFGERIAAQGAAELVLDRFLGPNPAVLVMD